MTATHVLGGHCPRGPRRCLCAQEGCGSRAELELPTPDKSAIQSNQQRHQQKQFSAKPGHCPLIRRKNTPPTYIPMISSGGT